MKKTKGILKKIVSEMLDTKSYKTFEDFYIKNQHNMSPTTKKGA